MVHGALVQQLVLHRKWLSWTESSESERYCLNGSNRFWRKAAYSNYIMRARARALSLSVSLSLSLSLSVSVCLCLPCLSISPALCACVSNSAAHYAAQLHTPVPAVECTVVRRFPAGVEEEVLGDFVAATEAIVKINGGLFARFRAQGVHLIIKVSGHCSVARRLLKMMAAC